MRILIRNCNGALRNKIDLISSFNYDLYVVQECEDRSQVIKPPLRYEDFTENHVWIGGNKNKGLGAFAKTSSSITKFELNMDCGEHQLKWFLPFTFENRLKFVAAWARRWHNWAT